MSENVEHPKHYNVYKGLEVWDLVEQMNFNRGNAVKYVTRAGHKSPDTEVEDLRKAKFYLEREIERIQPAKVKSEVVPTQGSSVISVVKASTAKQTMFGEIGSILKELGIPRDAATEIMAIIVAAEVKYRKGSPAG